MRPALDTVNPQIGFQYSRNPATPWPTSATLTPSKISVIVKLNLRTSIVRTRRTRNQLDAIATLSKTQRFEGIAGLGGFDAQFAVSGVALGGVDCDFLIAARL